MSSRNKSKAKLVFTGSKKVIKPLIVRKEKRKNNKRSTKTSTNKSIENSVVKKVKRNESSMVNFKSRTVRVVKGHKPKHKNVTNKDRKGLRKVDSSNQLKRTYKSHKVNQSHKLNKLHKPKYWFRISVIAVLFLIALIIFSFLSGVFASFPVVEEIFIKINFFLLQGYYFISSPFIYYTQESLMIILLALVGLIGGELIKKIVKISRQRKQELNKRKIEPKPEKENDVSVILKTGGYQTGIDQFYQIILKNKKMSLDHIAKELKLSKDLATEWAKVLEEHKLIEIDYPAFGSPVLTKFLPKDEQEVKNG